MEIIDDLINQACEIRDAQEDQENTALRVGTMLVDIIQYLASVVDSDALEEILQGYASLDRGLVNWRQSRIVFLASMGSALDNIDGGNWQYTEHNGDVVFNPAANALRVIGEQGNLFVTSGVAYVNLHTQHSYMWDATAHRMVEITDSSKPTVIDYRNTPAFADIAVGETYYYESGTNKKISIKLSSSDTYAFDPDPTKEYIFKDTRQSMIWDATAKVWIPIGNNTEIVDDLTTGGRDKALSAEQGKELNRRISESQSQPINIVDDMESDAASSATSASSARMVKEIYLNLKALFDPESGLANLAFVGQRPTWQTVAKRHYTLTFGTLDGLDSTTPVKDADGNAVTSGTQVNEGYLKLILKPASSSYAFTSITVNGNAVTSTPVSGASDGSVYIEITVNGNITLVATATNGYGVSAASGSHFTLNKASIEVGTDLSVIIAAESHYTLPSSDTDVSVKIGGVTSSNFTYTRSTEQSATLTIDKQYINGNIEITIATTAMTPIAITLQGSHVTYKYDGNVISGSHNLYPDDSVRIINVSPSGGGYSISSAPVVSGCTVASDNNGGYNITIPTTVTGSLTLNISAEANFWEVTVPSNVQNLTVTDANDDAFASNTVQVAKGSPFTCYIKAAFLWAANVAVTVGGSAAAEGFYTYDPATGALVIAAVTGDVVITATAVSDNPDYKYVLREQGNSSDTASNYYYTLRVYSTGFVSKLIDVHELSSVVLHGPAASLDYKIASYNAVGEEISYMSLRTATDRALSVSDAEYIRVYCPSAQVGSVYVYKGSSTSDDTQENRLWTGDSNMLNGASTGIDFMEKYGPALDEYDTIHAGFYTNTGYSSALIIVLGRNAQNGYSTVIGDFVASKEFELPAVGADDKRTIKFHLGDTPASSENTAPAVLCYNDLGETARRSTSNESGSDGVTYGADKKFTKFRFIVKRAKLLTEQMWVTDGSDNPIWDNNNIINANQSEE